MDASQDMSDDVEDTEVDGESQPVPVPDTELGLHNAVCTKCEEQFQPGQVYSNPKELKKTLDQFAADHSFSVVRDGNSFTCRRAGKKRQPKNPHDSTEVKRRSGVPSRSSSVT